ncbi:hypothetical protein [Legionella sp.]|uniref:hypothetical protein n=1 Tax=Legionella sp. TaxID=459 RepID=UPI003C8AB495
MLFKGKYSHLFLLLLLAGLNSSVVLAGSVGAAGPSFSYIPKVSLQLGGFWTTQGSRQHVDIDGLIGDQFSVRSGADSNGLVGVGLYWDGWTTAYADLSYGVNAFYLPHTSVSGYVTQENLFTNLAYSYSLTNWPIFFGGRADIHTSFLNESFLDNRIPSNISITLDAGIGPNIINAYNFKEYSLDGGITIPDRIFQSHSSVAFSAMSGAGLKFHDLFNKATLECGYRFFYLGQGNLSKANTQVLNTLKTGDSYANAALCAITI